MICSTTRNSTLATASVTISEILGGRREEKRREERVGGEGREHGRGEGRLLFSALTNPTPHAHTCRYTTMKQVSVRVVVLGMVVFASIAHWFYWRHRLVLVCG